MDQIQSWANYDGQNIKSKAYVKKWMDDNQVSWDLNHPKTFLNALQKFSKLNGRDWRSGTSWTLKKILQRATKLVAEIESWSHDLKRLKYYKNFELKLDGQDWSLRRW